MLSCVMDTHVHYYVFIMPGWAFDSHMTNSLCYFFRLKIGRCYGCINNGSAYMKHPGKDDAYTGGHLDTYSSFGYDRSDSDNSDNV
jgi:hypothetical protein